VSHYPQAVLEAFTVPSPEEVASTDASSVLADAGLSPGTTLLLPPTIPKQRGRPSKEHYLRYDHAQRRVQRATAKPKHVNIAGVAEPKKQDTCGKCGALGHHASGCTRFGFVAGKLAPIEAQQTAIVEATLAEEVQKEALLREQLRATPPSSQATKQAEQPVAEEVGDDPIHLSSSEDEKDQAPRPTRRQKFESATIPQPTHQGSEAVAWTRKPTTTEAEHQMIREAMHGPGDANIGSTWNACTRRDEAVTRSDLRSLRAGEWVAGQAIQSYLHLAVDLHRSHPNLPRVRLLKDINVAHKLRAGPDQLSGWFKRDKELFQWDRILIPTNTCTGDGSHWYFVVLDIEHRQVVSYDSLDSPCVHGFMRNILEWVQAELQSPWKKAQPASKALLQTNVLSWQRVVCKSLRQRDGHSCGVYCCQAALLVALGIDPATSNMSDADIPALRDRMVLSLLSGRIQV